MFISPSADPIVCWHQARLHRAILQCPELLSRLHRAILQCPELLSQQSDDFIGPDEFITHHKPATMSKLSWLAADWPPPVLLHGLTRRSGRYCLASLPDSEVVEGDKRAAEDEKDALGIRSLKICADFGNYRAPR